MQQFLLFCTMLIIACEAFSKDFHEKQIHKGIKRKASKFSPKLYCPNSDLPVFDDFNFPMFIVTPLHEGGEPLLIPVGRWTFKSRRKGPFSQRQEKFSTVRKKRFRKKEWKPVPLLNAHNLLSMSSPQCFDDVWLSGRDFRSRRDFANYKRDDFSSRDSTMKNLNPYSVCFSPMFDQHKVNKINLQKRRQLLNLKRNYLADLRNKNKRSAILSRAVKKISLNKGNETEEPEKLSFKRSKNASTALTNLKEDVQKMERSFVSPEKDVGSSFQVNSNLKEGKKCFLPTSTPTNHISLINTSQPAVVESKNNFKDDREMYQSTLRIPSQVVREKVGEESAKRNVKTDLTSSMSELGEILDEVQSALHKKSASLEEKETDQTIKSKLTKSLTLKEKIDKVVIPILHEISEELKQADSETSTSHMSDATETPDISHSEIHTTEQKNVTKKGHGKKVKGAKAVKEVKEVKEEKSISEGHCTTDGTWTSSVLGFDMIFTTLPNMMIKVKIVPHKESVIDSKWAIQGLTLTKHGGPVLLAAIYPQKRKIASFIGQCKICEEQDLIFGSWTIYTVMRKFTDLWRAVETKLDILHKKSDKSDKTHDEGKEKNKVKKIKAKVEKERKKRKKGKADDGK